MHVVACRVYSEAVGFRAAVSRAWPSRKVITLFGYGGHLYLDPPKNVALLAPDFKSQLPTQHYEDSMTSRTIRDTADYSWLAELMRKSVAQLEHTVTIKFDIRGQSASVRMGRSAPLEARAAGPIEPAREVGKFKSLCAVALALCEQDIYLSERDPAEGSFRVDEASQFGLAAARLAWRPRNIGLSGSLMIRLLYQADRAISLDVPSGMPQ